MAFTGRFQPFHKDHLDLVGYGLRHGERLVIGITNPDPRSLAAVAASAHRHLASANPFSYLERQRMIHAALDTAGVPRQRYDIVPFPLDAPAAWFAYIPSTAVQLVRVYSDWEREKVRQLAAGGYRLRVLPGDPAIRISGSTIRAALASSGSWRHWVPDGARECPLELRTSS